MENKDWFVDGEERSDTKLLRAMLRLLQDEGRKNVKYSELSSDKDRYFIIYVDGKKHIHIEDNICSFYSEGR